MTIPHGKIRVLLLAGILAVFQRGAIVWAFGPANHRLFFSERRERTMTEISERILSERAGEPSDPDSFDEVSVTPEMAGVANRAVSGPVFVRVRGNEVRWMWHVTARDYVQYVYDPEPAKEGGAGVPVGTGGRWRSNWRTSSSISFCSSCSRSASSPARRSSAGRSPSARRGGGETPGEDAF